MRMTNARGRKWLAPSKAGGLLEKEDSVPSVLSVMFLFSKLSREYVRIHYIFLILLCD